MENIIFCTNVVKINNYEWIIYIDLDKTSDNIKDIIKQNNQIFKITNIIKVNINYKFKYNVIDKFGNKKLEYFNNINLINKYAYIDISYNNDYSNYKINKLEVYDNYNNSSNYKNYKQSYNKSKSSIIKSIIK